MKKRKVIDIRVRRHSSTEKWYASCIIVGLGKYESWGDNDQEAIQNLIKLVAVNGGRWPVVLKFNPKKKNKKDFD